ncbi:MAG TPA: M1 family metallopeptidase [Flavitalea sp.]|nr:M1 family metallopeptidase [Flavitalea sp.]
MKFFTWLLAILISSGNMPMAQKARNVDVQRYIFEVELNDKNDSITAVATILFNLLRDIDNVSFDLISQRPDGKGMKIVSVTEKGKHLDYTHNNDVVHISLSSPGEQNESKTIKLQYRGIPADGLIISKNKYNHRTFFSDHWPNRARHWLACVDHPADKAAVEFKVTAPVHYQVISNGIMIEETNLDDARKLTHYQEDNPLPVKIAAIGVADFAVRYEGDVNNVPVQTWVFPEDRAKGFYDFGMALDIFPYFIKNIGPYPYKKLANVQSKTIFSGMENAGAIFYPEDKVTGKRGSEILIAHEITHQWFGDMATEADFAHIWLSEGFATYLPILYMEQKYGEDTAIKMRIEDRMQAIAYSKQRLAPIVDSSTTNYLDLLNANSYQKGGWILHMLRKQFGDTLFWNSIRSYYNEHAGKNAVTEDLRRAFERTTSRDLKKFFQQWLYTPGHPTLDIQWKYEPDKKQVVLNIIQTQKTIFDFPIEIEIVGSKLKELVTDRFMIKEKQTSIKIPTVFKPQQLLVDPSINLFYEGNVKELK